MRKVFAVALLVLVGCGSNIIYINRQGAVVAVLPPCDNTNGPIEIWQAVWPRFQHEFAARGYTVVAPSRITAFMQAKRFTNAAELNQFKTEELAKEFGADFVVYPQLDVWDRTTAIIYTKLKVGVSCAMRDKDGVEIWRGEGAESEEAAGLSGRQILAQTVGGLLSSMEHLIPPAVSECCGTLPHCGFEPQK